MQTVGCLKSFTLKSFRAIETTSRTTGITLDSLLRGKITIMLKIRNFENNFNNDKSLGL